MSVHYVPYGGLPADLSNFRTLVAQKRGYHFYFPDGLESSVFDFAIPLSTPYYTGLTIRIFGWIPDQNGGLDLHLCDGNLLCSYKYYAGITVNGMKLSYYESPLNSYTRNEHQASQFTLPVPGYVTLALRLELPSQMLAIFGENKEIQRFQTPAFNSLKWIYRFRPIGSGKQLSLHVSYEQGNQSSTVVLEASDKNFDLDFPKGVSVVVECRVVDISQDIVVSFQQDRGKYVQASFPPSGVQKNEQVVIHVRNSRDGWLVMTSFSPDSQLVMGQSRRNRTFPVLSKNCEVLRMRWDLESSYN